MGEFFKAELKDRFLKYALDKGDYFETQVLYNEFLRPNYSLDFVEKLVKEIIDYDPELLDIISGNGIKIFMLSATDFTTDFLAEGGFTNLYVQEEEKWDVFLEHLSNTRKLSAQEKAELGETEKSNYSRERTLLFGLILAVAISFLFTLYSLIKNIVDSDRYMTRDEFEIEIEKLRTEYQTESNKIMNELNTLKDKMPDSLK
ncbi:MAG: hypothetical protein HKP24_02350 [Croceitalea sp.]|nr:hypothetical protein [Croceitalea sp.]NNM17389.1 hypothetical protein [Croceitalea sp.]